MPVPKAPEDSRRTFVALTDFVSVIVEAEAVMETSPAVEVIEAFVRFVKAPVPESVIFPVALIAPVG